MKALHYWAELRAALTAGKWATLNPAKTPSGSALTWSELLRKFQKHCAESAAIAEIANQTQALALLLGEDVDQDDVQPDMHAAFVLGMECVLPEERLEEASAAYELLKNLQSPIQDNQDFILAYYAYAIGSPVECLRHLASVSDFSNITSRIPKPISTAPSSAPLQSSLGGETSAASSWGYPPSEPLYMIEIKDGRAWAITETIRSICLQGMSHERLSPADLKRALDVYSAALPLLTVIETEIASVPDSVPAESGKLNFISFTIFRELWRWVERLLWRAIILAARTKTILCTWLSHYTACSRYWPATFRTHHRSTINTIYLRALILSPSPSATPNPGTSSWLQTARTVINEYRAILTYSTRFPKAGQRNAKVEEFVDLCVAVWEVHGAVGHQAGWVIDILWWASRLTFNSYRVLRHMSRLSYVYGDVAMAKRSLQLYVQVVSKALEASNAGVRHVNADSTQKWVETLVQGARMLCRTSASGTEGMEAAREAGALIERAKAKVNSINDEWVARLDLAEGIWHSTMAVKEDNPQTRPERLSQCLEKLTQSVQRHPTASGHHHLALALARPGTSQDLEQAIVHAGMAVEIQPREVRHWHLLALLLAKTENWTAAKGAIEEGVALGEEDGNAGELSTESSVGRDGPSTTQLDNDSTTAQNADMAGRANERPSNLPPLQDHVIDMHTTEFPPAESLLAPLSDYPPCSSAGLFEQSLQLRMTQVALTEYMEGPESAGVKWFEVFKWIAEKRGLVQDQHRSSTAQSRISVDLKSPSELMLAPDLEKAMGSSNIVHGSENGAFLSVPPEVSGHGKDLSITIPHEESPQSPTNEKDNKPRHKGSPSADREKSAGRKVQRMLRNRVNKGQARITTNIKRLGARNGDARSQGAMSAVPGFNFTQPPPYQASSIHSRRRLSMLIKPHHPPRQATSSPPPPPPPPPIVPAPDQQTTRMSSRVAKENRLLSDLWLMSAATFRRQGKIEQAKAAIQEAEVRDEGNPAVWTQLGLYHAALDRDQDAVDAFQKALFICPDDISATVHLCRLYLSPSSEVGISSKNREKRVDLAAGLLSHLTRGAGWDSPEAWYYLAKACGLQGRKERERKCLSFALELSEWRGLRDMGTAIGHCL